MSDSDLSDAALSASIPPDSDLKQALRKQVRDALKAGNHESVTVSSMRKAAEEALGLDAGFYKNSEKWKEESKRIVHETFDEYGADPRAPEKQAKPAVSSKPARPKKRASLDESDDNGGLMKKRRKSQTALSSEEALSSPPSQLSEEEMEKPAPKIKTKKTSKKSELSSKPAKSKTNHKPNAKASESELSDAPDSPAPAENAPSSDSELSVLIDSEPPPKTNKKQKPLTGAEKRGRKPKTESSDLDPDAAEIKRLQSWLVKCGIRKLWGKELKPYETPKAKIKHLKVMLADAGMTGRYSLEKANQIKEQRELRADIEAVKEGAQRWGKGVDSDNEEDQGGDGRTKPKKRLVRGAQILDFLGSDDGEETD